MPTPARAARGGRFHWNAGGWFGGLVGCTAWLLAEAYRIASRAPRVAAFWAAMAAVVAAVGLVLWSCRDRVRPYLAVQGLLLVSGACGLAAWLVLDLGRPDIVRESIPRWLGYLALLVWPALMALCALDERRPGGG
jgi:hypothetical protein